MPKRCYHNNILLVRSFKETIQRLMLYDDYLKRINHFNFTPLRIKKNMNLKGQWHGMELIKGML